MPALGLAGSAPDGRLLLLQLPALLPLSPTGGAFPAPLEALPPGHLGTLRVHASGAVQLRCGGVDFDVLPGATAGHAEQLAQLHWGGSRPHAALLGPAGSRVVVTPDVKTVV